MPDPLSIASAVVGALALGMEVAKILDGFINDWRDAPEDVGRFKKELEYLIANLHKTSQILAPDCLKAWNANKVEPQPPLGTSPAVESVRTEYISFCTIELENLRDALSIPKTTRQSTGWDRIKRALRSTKLKESIEQVNRCCKHVSDDVTIETLATTQGLTNEFAQLQQDVRKRFEREDRSKILSWISQFDLEERHEFLLERHHEGSGRWLIEREDFMDWCTGCREDAEGNSVPPILWCYGIPGAGKSVMTSFVVELLKSRLHGDPKLPVIYAYCDYKERNKQKIEDLMSILLRQIVLHTEMTQGTLPEVVVKAYEEHAFGETHMRRSELRAYLVALLQPLRRSIIVFDALDEYVPLAGDAHSIKRVEIFDELQEVMKKCGDSCRMFITSRENCMLSYEDIVQATRLRIVAVEEDIRSYVSWFIHSEEFSYAEEVSNDPVLAGQIIESLVKHSNGQFLLPALHLKELSLQPSIRDLVDALDTLPTGLDDLYFIAIKRIRDQSRELKDLGMRILIWVINAARRLKVTELQHAVATRQSDTTFDKRGIIPSKKFITHTAGLLQIQNGNVECVHHTVTEFLKRLPPAELLVNPQTEIALTCLAYLKLSDFRDPTDDVEKRALDFPFLNYAALHWGYHASRCVEHESSYSQVFSDVLSRDQIPLGSLQVIAAKMAIVCGFDTVVDTILSNDDVDTEETGYKNETALHLAARSSSRRAVELLLSHSAKVNATNYSGKTALDMIMNAPYLQFSLKVLMPEFLDLWVHTLMSRLLADANQSSPHEMSKIDKSMKTLLQEKGADWIIVLMASYRQSPEHSRLPTKAILARGFKMDISDEDEEIVKLLIKAGIDVNSQGFPEATALQLAAIYGRQELVQLLLEKDANPFLQREFGWTACDLAKHCGHDQIAELLSRKMDELQKVEDETLCESAKLEVPDPLQ